MVREDRGIMSVKELRRVSVIRQTREKTLTQVQAGTLLGLTPRHIRRLIERVEQEGDQGLAHWGRGMPSNRRLPAKVKAKALRLYAQRYGDFGPTLAAEKRAECHGVPISDETLRRWTASSAMCRTMGFRWPSTRTSIRPINRQARPPWRSSGRG